MAAAGHAGRDGSRHDPGGRTAEGAPAGGARRVGGRAVAGTLSAGGLAAAAFSLALVLAVPGGTAGANATNGTNGKTLKISTAKIAGIGTVLTTSSGLTLYRFADDRPNTASCSGACASIWPPLLASKGAHVSGPKGVKGLSLLKVGNGQWQVTFHKLPLYRFEGDKKKGQANGQNIGKVWFAVLKSGIPANVTAGAAATTTTAPSASTTRPVTSTTSGSGSGSGSPSNSSGGSNVTTPTQAPTPASQPTTMVTQPPPPTTTSTTTATAGGGGVGF